MAKAKGRLIIKPAKGGSISIGTFDDSGKKEKVVLTIRDDNEAHDFGVCILEDWEADAVIASISIILGKIRHDLFEYEPKFMFEDGELKKIDK